MATFAVAELTTACVRRSTAPREGELEPLPKALRRDFLETAGALVLAVALPAIPAIARAARTVPKGTGTDVNAFVRVGADGIVTLIIGKSEMGQGIYTGYAQLIAEELEVDWQAIRVESAPVAMSYNNPGSPFQFTGGSDSTLTGFSAMREAGALARVLLIASAAERLHVPQTELVAEKRISRTPCHWPTTRLWRTRCSSRPVASTHCDP